MPEIKLKPCRFCGGRGRIMRAGNNAYVVRCKDCGAQTARSFIKDWHRNKYIAQGNAAEAWNRHADGWHKYPKEKPKYDGYYHITIAEYPFDKAVNVVCLAEWYEEDWHFSEWHGPKSQVVAWREIEKPEPWEGE